MSSREALAALIRAEIAASGLSQARLAARAVVTPKHMSQVVNGQSGSLEVLDRILAALGRDLVVATRVRTKVSDVDPA